MNHFNFKIIDDRSNTLDIQQAIKYKIGAEGQNQIYLIKQGIMEGVSPCMVTIPFNDIALRN